MTAGPCRDPQFLFYAPMIRRIFALGLISLLHVVAEPPAGLEKFFKSFAFDQVQLSPDGSQVAALAAQEGRLNLFILDLESMVPRRVTAFWDKDVANYWWQGNDRLIFTVQEDGYLAGGLFAINTDGGRMRVLGESVKQQSDRGSLVYRHVEYMGLVEGDPDDILVSSNERDEFEYDIYRMNTRTGRKRLVARNPGQVEQWVHDGKGQVRVAFGQRGLERFVLYRENNDAEWSEVRRSGLDEGEILPLRFADDSRNLYVLSNVGRDTWSLRRFDPVAGELGEVYFENPVYDAGGVVTELSSRRLLGVRYEGERPEIVWSDPEMKRLQAMLDASLPGTSNWIYSRSHDGEKMIVLAWSDRDPGQFYLLDRPAKRLEPLVARAPWIDPQQMAEMRPISYTARDGRKIHGYLTLPPGAGTGPHPLIVNPHGGPWVRDSWGFNREVQFLASRGYAVLQMNFRGSTGYGRNHLEAGYGQWGLAMQDDITDGVQWAIAEGIADQDRVAIYGASYGGYATMAGLTFTPELYRCGINYVGVTDISLLLRTIPKAWESSREQLEVMTGNARRDRERLEATSPLRHVDRIRVPLFLAYGERDERVDIKHAQALIAQLKKHDKAYEYMVKSTEGHGYRREENQIEFYSELERFLGQHLR